MSENLILPDRLVRNMTELHGADGLAWVRRLPTIVAGCARQWSLTIAPPFPYLSYNYVAPRVRADGTEVVLKVCCPGHQFLQEAEALRLFDGRGASHLLAVDYHHSALLLERLVPGTRLAAITSEEQVTTDVVATDDEQATSIIASIMRRLWRPVPVEHPFPSVADWVMGMAERAPRLVRPTSPFPAAWIDRALALFADLTASPAAPVILHGDLHHGNVLAAEREPWLAIDPKGVVGELAWETGPLLLNALPSPLAGLQTRQLLDRRVAQLAEELGVDRERLRAWGVVRAVLAGFWTLEDHGHDWEGALIRAQHLAGHRA